LANNRAEAERVHGVLQTLAARVAAERIYFRDPVRAQERFQAPIPTQRYAVSDRDRVVCGLVAKATQTHAAIGLLAKGNLAQDALALARVMMENVFSVSWILQEPEFRTDLFFLSSTLFRRHLAELVITHYTHRPDAVARAKKLLEDEHAVDLATRLAGSWDKWARRDEDGRLVPIGARGIFLDLGVKLADGTKQSFAYEVMYFAHSHQIHSTADSLDAIYRQELCTLSPPVARRQLLSPVVLPQIGMLPD